MIHENVPAGAVRELNDLDYLVGQPIEQGDVVTVALADGTFQRGEVIDIDPPWLDIDTTSYGEVERPRISEVVVR